MQRPSLQICPDTISDEGCWVSASTARSKRTLDCS
jgi:hypothetical protein